MWEWDMSKPVKIVYLIKQVHRKHVNTQLKPTKYSDSVPKTKTERKQAESQIQKKKAGVQHAVGDNRESIGRDFSLLLLLNDDSDACVFSCELHLILCGPFAMLHAFISVVIVVGWFRDKVRSFRFYFSVFVPLCVLSLQIILLNVCFGSHQPANRLTHIKIYTVFAYYNLCPFLFHFTVVALCSSSSYTSLIFKRFTTGTDFMLDDFVSEIIRIFRHMKMCHASLEVHNLCCFLASANSVQYKKTNLVHRWAVNCSGHTKPHGHLVCA